MADDGGPICFFFSNKKALGVLAWGSIFSPQQYLASYIKRNIATITNVSKHVKLCYCSTALTDPLWYLSLLQNFWSFDLYGGTLKGVRLLWRNSIFLLIYRFTVIYLEVNLERRWFEAKWFDYCKNFLFLKKSSSFQIMLLAGNNALYKWIIF